jgi:hypothetical protein
MNVQPTEVTEPASGYRAVSPLAVGSLVLGLLAPIALVGSLLWIVPALGIALAVLALRAIKQSSGELTGRRAAMVGLVLNAVFATAGPVNQICTRYWLAGAAQPIADAWFDFLRHDEPHKALQLGQPALQRRVLNDLLWDYYGSSKENRKELEHFVSSPVPRLVLEYGEKCQARFYEIASVVPANDRDMIDLIYVVTYPAPSGKQSFFVRMIIERRVLLSGDIAWRIASNEGGIRPPSMLP